MNGRHVVSWGLNLGKSSSGKTYRALYEPSDRYQHRGQDGVVLMPAGIEARSFRFVPGPEEDSAAGDGGLVEVQIFRSQGRNRRAPSLDRYRNQEKYGIA